MADLYYPEYLQKRNSYSHLSTVINGFKNANHPCKITQKVDGSRFILAPASNSDIICGSGGAAAPGRSLYDRLAPEDIKRISEGKMKLIIDLGYEAFNITSRQFLQMQITLRKFNIDPKNIVVVNSNTRSLRLYKYLCDRNKVEPTMGLANFEIGGLMLLANQRKSHEEFKEFYRVIRAERASDEPRKAYLNFNGRLRAHRISLVLFILQKNLEELGFVSLLGYGKSEKGTKLRDFNIENRADNVEFFASQISSMGSIEGLMPTIETLVDRMPIELDLVADDAITSQRYRYVTPFEMQDIALYNRSYFSVVTDTLMDSSDNLFITEKVFKPMLAFHPFIYFGNAGALKRLRELGFQTFEPYIDERYDNEQQVSKRLDMALQETLRLATLPETQLRGIYAKLWPVLTHNARHGFVSSAKWGAELVAKEFISHLV